MLSEILLETLSFLDRSSLEACQLVNRSLLKMITKSNAALALRPMDKLSVHCRDAQRYIEIDEIAKFEWHDSLENEDDDMYLQIGTDWDQPQAVAEKIVARTRNTFINKISFWCVQCASIVIALWRDSFDDRTPCRAAELSFLSRCLPSSHTDFQQLLQPLAGSKLGVVRYEIIVLGNKSREEQRDTFDALWSAWDRPTTRFVTFDLHGLREWPRFFEKSLHEPNHAGRHYTVESDDSAELVQMVESYVQKFEDGGSELNFPTSLAFYRVEFTDNTVYKLRMRPRQTLEKPPKRSIHAPRGLWPGCFEESHCDVYEIRNLPRRQTMHAYFWVATRPSYYSTGEDHFFHCHWFTVTSF